MWSGVRSLNSFAGGAALLVIAFADTSFAAPNNMRLPLLSCLWPAAVSALTFGLQPQPPAVASGNARAAVATATSEAPPDAYSELKKLDSMVSDLSSNTNEMLLGFYDQGRSCFALTPGRPRFSITSTCCSLLAIHASRLRWRNQPGLNVDRVVEALLLEEWRSDDLYQLTLCTSALMLLDPKSAALRRHPSACAKFAAAVETILDARPSRQRRNERTSAYTRHSAAWNTQP